MLHSGLGGHFLLLQVAVFSDSLEEKGDDKRWGDTQCLGQMGRVRNCSEGDVLGAKWFFQEGPSYPRPTSFREIRVFRETGQPALAHLGLPSQ